MMLCRDQRITYQGFTRGSLNPFWSGSAADGKLDVSAYLARHNFSVPSAATIMLGDNDLSGANTDAEADHAIAQMVPNLKALVQALHGAGVRSVGLVWQPLPSDQDGFGANYGVMGNTGPPNNTQRGVSNAYREKRAMLRWWAAQAQLARWSRLRHNF